ncbi:hypothetical protein CsatA_000980 [Cannabis sativa]
MFVVCPDNVWLILFEMKLYVCIGRAEMVVKEVENVAEMVEKVALVAEKMSSEVVDELPENGALKKTAMLVERLSHKAAQESHLTKQFIHKRALVITIISLMLFFTKVSLLDHFFLVFTS